MLRCDRNPVMLTWFQQLCDTSRQKASPNGGSFLLLNLNWKRELGFAAFGSIPLWVLPVPQGTANGLKL